MMVVVWVETFGWIQCVIAAVQNSDLKDIISKR